MRYITNMNFIEEKIRGKGNPVVLRFPPEPNGYLHLGHAKSVCLNFGLAEKLSGKCYLRFDDTNPSTEDTEFVRSIMEDVRWLGFEWEGEPRFTSDYFSSIHGMALLLIKKGLAYVDDSSSEEIAESKGTPTVPGKESPYRNRSVVENIGLFMGMMNDPEGSRTLRARIDMASPNMLMRDPVIYRIIDKPHHRTGRTWRVYPMYDFAHPISDYLEGVTDSLCTLEFEVHRPLYMWFLENLDLTPPLPEETEFARLNIDYTVMSKRKLKTLVEKGHVDGWDDPRMPTLSGLRRRGYTPSVIRNFCERVGVTKRESVHSHMLLEECLREELNRTAPRFMGVSDPIRLVIKNWPGGTEKVSIENNPENPEEGKREVDFSGTLLIEREDFRVEADKSFFRLKMGGEVRLKGAYIVKAVGFKMTDGVLEEVHCTYDPETRSGSSERKVKGTIHWVSEEHAEPMEIREYGKLFSVPAPEEEEDFLGTLNSESVRTWKGFVEPGVSDLPVGSVLSLIRKGYYIVDRDGNLNMSVSLRADKGK